MNVTIGVLAAAIAMASSFDVLAGPADLDPGFAGSGVRIENLHQIRNTEFWASLPLADGSRIVAGEVGNDAVVARLLADGSTDPAFNGGLGLYVAPPSSATFHDIAAAPGGKVVVVGIDNVNTAALALARLHADGTPDASFGAGGYATSNLMQVGQSVAVQADGRVVVGGYSDAPFVVARFELDGSPDFTFNSTGAAGIPFGGQFSRLYDIALDPADGGIVVVGLVETATPYDLGIARLTAFGLPDTAFDGDGVRLDDVNSPFEQHPRVLVQPDRRIVVGYTQRTAGPLFRDRLALRRYLSNGSLDPSLGGTGSVVFGPATGGDYVAGLARADDGGFLLSSERFEVVGGNTITRLGLARTDVAGALLGSFGSGGLAAFDLDPAQERVHQVEFDTSGRAVTVGTFRPPGGGLVLFPAFAVRVNSTGALDPAFGTGGIVKRALSSEPDRGKAVAIDAAGRIVVGAELNVQFPFNAVVRVLGDGSLDASFGSGGIAQTAVGANSMQLADLALRADGAPVITGVISTFAVGRLTTAGALDAGFGAGGYISTSFGGNGSFAGALTVQDDGKIVAVGSRSNTNFTTDAVAARYLENSSLDGGFANVGRLATSLLEGATDVAIDANGNVLLAGLRPSPNRMGVARFDGAGVLDGGFGSGGVAVGATAGLSTADAIAVQADGRIVLAGNEFGVGFAVARFLVNGSPDPGFGTGGVTSFAVGPGPSAALDVAIQADGKIVLSGTSGALGAVARLESDGDPDPTFNAVGSRTFAIGAVASFDGVAVQADGRIVLAGRTESGILGESDTLLVRLEGDDSAPDAFGFPAQNGVTVSTLLTSDIATMTGLGTLAPVVVAGGEYSIGCTATFTSARSTIANGASVCVRHVSAATAGATVTTTLTIGGFAAAFQSTTLAPSDTTLQSVPPALSTTTAATFTFSASDASATFECALDAAGFAGCTSPTDLVGLGQGPHTFQVRAVNGAGPDPTPATHNWTIDSVAPQTTIDSGPVGTLAFRDAQFMFSADESGSALECRLDAGAFAACTSPRGFTSLALGPHVFDAQARDVAGNLDPTPATRAWTIALPDAFGFPGQSGVGLSSTAISDPATVGGVDLSPIAISRGEYSIGCGAIFVSTPGTVAGGQTVCVRHAAAALPSRATTTTLDLAGVLGTFTSTTGAGPLACAEYAAAVQVDDPVAYWRLDDPLNPAHNSASGASSVDTAAEGAYVASAAVPGLLGGCASGAHRFAAGDDGRMASAAFEKLAGGTGYTIEFLVRLASAPGTGPISFAGDGEGASDFAMVVEADIGGGLHVVLGTTFGEIVVAGASQLAVGPVHHVAATFNGADGELKVFVDGVETNSLVVGAGLVLDDSANPFFVGTDLRTGSTATTVMDEVAIYKRALAPARVAEHARIAAQIFANGFE